jgi:hypothetical protein
MEKAGEDGGRRSLSEVHALGVTVDMDSMNSPEGVNAGELGRIASNTIDRRILFDAAAAQNRWCSARL